ncbi:MAG: phosphoglycerate dehydrogenase, partial [Acetobacteraceae bacterium]|nr:phosphoglycerate dehydrogenase [Acetobacteraceae bacterium]
PYDGAHTRYLHVHQNVPGVLGKLNAVFSTRGLNVHAQSLQTDGQLGYVVVDADSPPAQRTEILQALCDIEGTVRARVVG